LESNDIKTIIIIPKRKNVYKYLINDNFQNRVGNFDYIMELLKGTSLDKTKYTEVSFLLRGYVNFFIDVERGEVAEMENLIDKEKEIKKMQKSIRTFKIPSIVKKKGKTLQEKASDSVDNFINIEKTEFKD